MTMRKLREIDFLLNFCDKYLACFTCGVKLNKYRCVQVWKVERWKQTHSTDSSQGCRKSRAFNCGLLITFKR